MKFDAIIIGAGAAGLMCAQAAGKRGRRILVLEHNDRIGKKILISGGGRCNFTNLYTGPENFLSSNPPFCKSALARFTPSDFLKLIQKHQISYYEKKLGQLFCEKSAKEITQMLLKECEEAEVKILTNCKNISVGAIHESPLRFEIKTSRGIFSSSRLVIATGGLSFPNLGASPLAYEIAEQFQIKVIPPSAALVPLLWGKEDLKNFSELSGISIEAVVSCHKNSFRENILFTHRGLSGPAILQISSYWKKGESLHINLLPDLPLGEWLLEQKNKGVKAQMKNLLSQFISKRFLEIWCERYFPSNPLQQTSDSDLHKIASLLQNWEILPAGDEGYEKAELTAGGIDTHELSSQSFESKKMPGLYFIGECIDVAGHLGGYNFQWAWASGMAAGACL